MAEQVANGGHGAGGGFELDPLHQFEIHTIVPINVGGLDLSLTNSGLWMLIAVGVAALLLTLPTRGRTLVPGRMQTIAETLYEITANMLRESAGSAGRRFFPFILTLFMFLLFGNLLGLVPGSFTYTSHIIITFALAAVVFLGTTVIGFVKHGPGFVKFFVPEGSPGWATPMLVLIELISYLSRPISLSVRLFANMLVGHTLLKTVAAFVVPLGVAGIFPLAGAVAVYALEVLVAVLQAYVFAILSCIYLNDALNMH